MKLFDRLTHFIRKKQSNPDEEIYNEVKTQFFRLKELLEVGVIMSEDSVKYNVSRDERSYEDYGYFNYRVEYLLEDYPTYPLYNSLAEPYVIFTSKYSMNQKSIVTDKLRERVKSCGIETYGGLLDYLYRLLETYENNHYVTNRISYDEAKNFSVSFNLK